MRSRLLALVAINTLLLAAAVGTNVGAAESDTRGCCRLEVSTGEGFCCASDACACGGDLNCSYSENCPNQCELQGVCP